VPFLYQAIAGFIIVVVQVLASKFLTQGGAMPDFVLVYVVVMVISRGQLVGEVTGFSMGLLLDILSSGTLGANALAKAVTAFFIGYFYSEDAAKQRLRNWPLLAFVALGAIINNLIYYALFAQARAGFFDFVLENGGLAVLYTTLVAIIPMFYFSRRPLY
jgi:rod shape-determining protein MreD